MAPNGVWPVNGNYALHVPPKVSRCLMEFCWQQLQQQHGGALPEELKVFAGECPALLCTYAAHYEYASAGAASSPPLHKLITNCDSKWLVEVGLFTGGMDPRHVASSDYSSMLALLAGSV